MKDALRLSLGTLTALPTSPPESLDRRVGSWAMTLAPLVGTLLAVLAGGFLWLLDSGSASPLLVAALTIGLLAVLTRALHLDGLADTADGLGSGKPAEEALAIMRGGDIGPFGVITLALVLLTQVVALAEHIAEDQGTWAAALALVVSRTLLPLACSRGIPAARADGLGRLVAGSVNRAQLLVATALAGLPLALFAVAFSDGAYVEAQLLVSAATGAGAGLLAGGALCWWCVRRLGGITGDVLGAGVETSFVSTLVALSLL